MHRACARIARAGYSAAFVGQALPDVYKESSSPKVFIGDLPRMLFAVAVFHLGPWA